MGQRDSNPDVDLQDRMWRWAPLWVPVLVVVGGILALVTGR